MKKWYIAFESFWLYVNIAPNDAVVVDMMSAMVLSLDEIFGYQTLWPRQRTTFSYARDRRGQELLKVLAELQIDQSL